LNPAPPAGRSGRCALCLSPLSHRGRLQPGVMLGDSFSLHFNGHFPGGPVLASTKMSQFWILLELRVMEDVNGDN